MKKISIMGFVIISLGFFVFPQIVFAISMSDCVSASPGSYIWCKNVTDGKCRSVAVPTSGDLQEIDDWKTGITCNQNVDPRFGTFTPIGCTLSQSTPPECVTSAGQQGTQSAGTSTKSQPTFNPDWTKDECTKAGGDWLPDDPGKTSGQYCFAKQNVDYTPQISIGEGKIANLGDYVVRAYNYALGFVLMIAIIMVMVGGVQWILARGGGGVEAAKKRISNAVLGVILLLAAYLILNTISPAIVKLSLPRIPLNKANKFAFSDVSNCGGYKDASSCSANAVGINKGWNCVAPIGTTSTGCRWDATSKTCVLAPPAASGGLFAQCPNGNECQSGLTCVKMNLTFGCTACTDGKIGSPCASSGDCAEGAECDDNTKQCRGELDRPIGSVCETAADPSQCATGFCDPSGGGLKMSWYTIVASTGICKSKKIMEKDVGAICTDNQFKPISIFSPTLVMYFKHEGLWDDKASAQCYDKFDNGTKCYLSTQCKNSCSTDNVNRNATNINQVQEGSCQ